MMKQKIDKILVEYINGNEYYKYLIYEQILNKYFIFSLCFFIIIVNLYNAELLKKQPFIFVSCVSTVIFLLFLFMILWKYVRYEYAIKIKNYSKINQKYVKERLLKRNYNLDVLSQILYGFINNSKSKQNNFFDILIPVSTFFCSFLFNNVSINGDILIILIVITTAFICGASALIRIFEILYKNFNHSPTLSAYELLLNDINVYCLKIKRKNIE